MTWLRSAIGVVAALAIGAVLVFGGSGTDPRAPEFLRIPGIGAGEKTVVIDSLGNPVKGQIEESAARVARRWLRRARPLGDGAPGWAQRMYLRSLLVLQALTDRNGAVVAGAREGWAYVWPRDAGAVALAYAAAGYRDEARRVARFLLGLDLDTAARFYRDGTPVEGREAQGDALGWVEVAAHAAALPPPTTPFDWYDRADYQEKDAGDYLGNAIASGTSERELRELIAARLDSAVAWAVQPFPYPALLPIVRRSLRRLIDERGGRFGIVPSEDWPEDDPWTAPTAWTAWAFAALADTNASAVPLPRYLEQRNSGADGERLIALGLMDDLRRAATPLGLLPERIDAQTGEPRSTTPLAWSHAFAILALRELWP